jgi:superoxide dismutase
LKGTEIEKDYPRLENLLTNLNQLPSDIREDVRFFGGGLLNHNFFFRLLISPKLPSTEPKINEKLLDLIKQFLQKKNLLESSLSLQDLSPLEVLKKELVKSALKVRGSG